MLRKLFEGGVYFIWIESDNQCRKISSWQPKNSSKCSIQSPVFSNGHHMYRVSHQSSDNSNNRTLQCALMRGVVMTKPLLGGAQAQHQHTSEPDAYLCYIWSQSHSKSTSNFIKTRTKVSVFGSLVEMAGGWVHLPWLDL